MNTAQQSCGLTAEKIQMFVAGLSSMVPEEARKAKLLFIRNELSEFKALKTSYDGFGFIQGCFAIIPIFWPILWFQRSAMKASLTMHAEQIRNAITIWRDDLGVDADALERELSSLLS